MRWRATAFSSQTFAETFWGLTSATRTHLRIPISDCGLRIADWTTEDFQIRNPQSAIRNLILVSLRHFHRGRRFHAYADVLCTAATDLLHPAHHVRRVDRQSVVLYDPAHRNQAVGLDHVGKLPAEVLLYSDDGRCLLQQRFRGRRVKRPQVGKVHHGRFDTAPAQPLLRLLQQGPGAPPPHQDRLALRLAEHLRRLYVLVQVDLHLARALLHHRFADGRIGADKPPLVVLGSRHL